MIFICILKKILWNSIPQSSQACVFEKTLNFFLAFPIHNEKKLVFPPPSVTNAWPIFRLAAGDCKSPEAEGQVEEGNDVFSQNFPNYTTRGERLVTTRKYRILTQKLLLKLYLLSACKVSYTLTSDRMTQYAFKTCQK